MLNLLLRYCSIIITCNLINLHVGLRTALRLRLLYMNDQDLNGPWGCVGRRREEMFEQLEGRSWERM